MTLRPTNLVLALSGSLTLVLACTRNDGHAGTTTLRSGTPERIRPANQGLASSFEADAGAAERLAGALCKHKRECASARATASMEYLLSEELVCVADRTPEARALVDRVDCSPAIARAGFKSCFAAIESMSCTVDLVSASLVPSCNASAICDGSGRTLPE